ncbi:YrdB family protein [Demetria terragena]|uniref:YrdB family protein n=1 Tax=Demetria terragena TaxID=63959 RepID=UPI00037FBC7D|nr:YrdB family protein [Demetria terragena]
MIRPGEALMFVLELAAYFAVAWWAFQLGDSTLTGALFALAAIAVMGLVWGLFCAPQAPYPIYGTPRIVVELAWFGAAVLALVLSGLWWIGALLAVVVIGLMVYRLRVVGR